MRAWECIINVGAGKSACGLGGPAVSSMVSLWVPPPLLTSIRTLVLFAMLSFLPTCFPSHLLRPPVPVVCHALQPTAFSAALAPPFFNSPPVPSNSASSRTNVFRPSSQSTIVTAFAPLDAARLGPLEASKCCMTGSADPAIVHSSTGDPEGFRDGVSLYRLTSTNDPLDVLFCRLF